jgi:hypothetical protein
VALNNIFFQLISLNNNNYCSIINIFYILFWYKKFSIKKRLRKLNELNIEKN